jgi:hypothetical protein
MYTISNEPIRVVSISKKLKKPLYLYKIICIYGYSVIFPFYPEKRSVGITR